MFFGHRDKTKAINSYGFYDGSPFTLSSASLARLSSCEPRSLQNPTSFIEGSLLYGGAVTNPKNLRRGLRCNQPRSIAIPVDPPVTRAHPQCMTRTENDHEHLQNDCCSCSSATGSTGTASLTGSFVMK